MVFDVKSCWTTLPPAVQLRTTGVTIILAFDSTLAAFLLPHPVRQTFLTIITVKLPGAKWWKDPLGSARLCRLPEDQAYIKIAT